MKCAPQRDAGTWPLRPGAPGEQCPLPPGHRSGAGRGCPVQGASWTDLRCPRLPAEGPGAAAAPPPPPPRGQPPARPPPSHSLRPPLEGPPRHPPLGTWGLRPWASWAESACGGTWRRRRVRREDGDGRPDCELRHQKAAHPPGQRPQAGGRRPGLQGLRREGCWQLEVGLPAPRDGRRAGASVGQTEGADAWRHGTDRTEVHLRQPRLPGLLSPPL